MDYYRTADEIIRLLTLCQQETTEQTKGLDGYRKRRDWSGLLTHCRQRCEEEAGESLSRGEYWRGIDKLCNGAYWYARHKSHRAVEYFLSSKRIFEREGHLYCLGVALMAIGRAYQALDEHREALNCYEHSCKVFRRLWTQCETGYDSHEACMCQELCDCLQSMKSEVQGSTGLHFIRLVGQVAAGRPLYMPGEGSEYPTEEIVLDARKYRLLSLRTRSPLRRAFGSYHHFFSTQVEGRSMIEEGIRSGDLLLAKWQESEPEQRQVAVFHIEDRGPVVKRFRREANVVYLDSANSDFEPLEFYEPTVALRTVGVVVAILEEGEIEPD